jgi:hypothetical protein
MSIYRICNWDHRFENSSSRKLKRLDWVALPNAMDIEGYIVLVDHPNGAAHFGAWIAIVQIASKQDPRGTLPNGKTSQSLGGICQSLGRISRLPAVLFEETLPRLIEIGWLEILGDSADALGKSATTLGDSADALGKSADTDIHTNKQTNRQTEQRKIPETSSNLLTPNIHAHMQNGDSAHGWAEFTEAYIATGRDTTAADLTNSKPIWKKLSLGDQVACVSGIRRDIEYQKYSGPEFWPKPKKYLIEREWTRKPPTRRTEQKETLAERIAKL